MRLAARRRGGILKPIKQVYNPTETAPISESRSGLVTVFGTWRNQLVQIRAPAGHLENCVEITPEGYSKKQSTVLTQRPNSWGSAPPQFGRVRQAITNTGRFRVGGSLCGPQQARLSKSAVTLAILTQFESQKGVCVVLQILGCEESLNTKKKFM